MEKITALYHKLLRNTSLDFTREIEHAINWDSRLIGICGARGIGKTTLLLQHIKTNFSDLSTALYVSLNNIWFTGNTLVELADHLVKKGTQHLFLDEVHKYPNWAQEIKNLYDNYPELKVVFTGSSLLEILNSRSDLSRRAVVYDMQGLSFREYLSLETKQTFPIFSLTEILNNHATLCDLVLKKIKPLKYFSTYLQSGYYPFYRESGEFYHQQIQAIINLIVEIELPLLRHTDIAYSSKIKQLLWIIAESVPFIPNVVKLSEKTGINRQTLLSYIHYLSEAGLTKNLYKSSKGISLLQKPEKIFLENTNLAYALSSQNPNIGSMRESFFYNQLSYQNKVTFPEKADFLVNKELLFEVGGSSKTQKLLTGTPNFYIAADDLEYGYENKIPLWLFGFLY